MNAITFEDFGGTRPVEISLEETEAVAGGLVWVYWAIRVAIVLISFATIKEAQ